MPSFKIKFAEVPKLVGSCPSRTVNHLYFSMLAVAIGAAFLVALYYSLSDLAQIMASGVMKTFYD